MTSGRVGLMSVAEEERAVWRAAASRAVRRDVDMLADALGGDLAEVDRGVLVRVVNGRASVDDLQRLAALIRPTDGEGVPMWTVLGVWLDGEPVPVGVVRGDHSVSGGDEAQFEEGLWAESVAAVEADAAERLAVDRLTLS
jgi:hypothetical protein